MTPIGTLLILAFLTASSWTLVSIVHRLRRDRAAARWWVALAALVVVGLSVGVWSAFHCEYNWGPNYRVGSFPLPIVFFHLEDGNWVDFPVPRIQAWTTAFTNIISVTALATLPLWVLSWRQQRNERSNSQPANAG